MGGANVNTFVPFTGVFENTGMFNHSMGTAPRFVEYSGVTVPPGSKTDHNVTSLFMPTMTSGCGVGDPVT